MVCLLLLGPVVHKGLKSSKIKVNPGLKNKRGLNFAGLKRNQSIIEVYFNTESTSLRSPLPWNRV